MSAEPPLLGIPLIIYMVRRAWAFKLARGRSLKHVVVYTRDSQLEMTGCSVGFLEYNSPSAPLLSLCAPPWGPGLRPALPKAQKTWHLRQAGEDLSTRVPRRQEMDMAPRVSAQGQRDICARRWPHFQQADDT